MPELNNITTTDAYSEANTLECPIAERYTLQVNNAAVYYQYTRPRGAAPRGEQFGTEEFLQPAIYNFSRRTTRIRVRSAVAGTPAQVSILAYP